jgi:hypothetical protein
MSRPQTVHRVGTLAGDAYEAWVAGLDRVTGVPRGRLCGDGQAVRFVEVVEHHAPVVTAPEDFHDLQGLDAGQRHAVHALAGGHALVVVARPGTPTAPLSAAPRPPTAPRPTRRPSDGGQPTTRCCRHRARQAPASATRWL